jgi:succinyldiaminopimelate transaminase
VKPALNPVLTSAPVYPFAALEERKAALRAEGRPLYDFTLGDPLEPTPAFIREALLAGVPETSQYPTVAGRRSLREAIARYVRRRFGVELDPETEILPCSGAKEAVFHLPLALIDRASPKRTVVWGEPAYPVYERGAAYAGADPHPVTLTEAGGFLLDPRVVPDDVLARTQLVWLNTPHNPTGAVAGRAALERLAEASRHHGFVLASDETYADLHDGTPPPSLLEVSRENVLVIHSLSKRSGMTGYRSGFIAGDARLIAALRKMRPGVGVASPVFVQAAAEAAWSDDAHVEVRRRTFDAKRRLVLDLCRDLGLSPLPGAAGLYVWIRTPDGMTSEAYAGRLLEKGVVVTPGGAFGPAGEGWFRVALVPLLGDLPDALAAWRRA